MQQKRCYRQEFRLRPETMINEIIEYVLAYCADKYDIELHEFVVMSNHDHLVHTDTQGNRPEFYGLFHSLVARAVNAVHGEWESVWSAQRYSAPTMEEPQDTLRKCIYTLLNPVDAELVRYAWDWQGVTSYRLEYGKPKVIRRPDAFFSDKMPEQVELVIRRPKGLRPELDNRQLRREIRAAVKREQRAVAERVRGKGRRFLGMDRVRKQPRHGSPRDRGRRRGIRPTVAAKSKWTRIEALQRNQRFLAEHRDARSRFEKGERDVAFPAGTYLMRARYGVSCLSP
jgi:REP element-mobilizing transposase RayT